MRSLREKVRYGLLIDIGSGSIGFAIVESDATKKAPKTIWEQREHLKVKQIDSISDASRTLLATLTDVAMTVPNTGLAALYAHTGSKRTKLASIQATIAAPWSYTVSRTVTYEQSEPFAVTDDLVSDLAVAASEEAMKTFTGQYSNLLQDVSETSQCVLDTYANGYRLPTLNKQQTTHLQLTHTTTLVYSTLLDALNELNAKLFSDLDLHCTSAMLSFYYTTRELKPHVYDVCLVDITNEATEIGIVRDGSLRYCTHTPFGSISIAREIAAAEQRPLSEVTSRLGEILEQKQTKTTTPVLNAYGTKITELFKETGDALSIPRTIYLMADSAVYAALLPSITTAAKNASKTNATVLPITELLQKKPPVQNDLMLEIAARFFHTSTNRQQFTYL
jgi:hypothetical protein